MIIVTGPRHEGILPRLPKGIAGRSNIERPTSNEKQKKQKSGKDRSRRSEVRGQEKIGDRGQKSEIGSQKSEIGSQRSEVRDQRAEERG